MVRERLLFLFFSFPVEIFEPVVLQANEVLIRSEPARGIVDCIEQIYRIIFRLKNPNLVVGRRAFGRKTAHFADEATKLGRLHELPVARPSRG